MCDLFCTVVGISDWILAVVLGGQVMSEVDRWDMERVDYEDYCMVLRSSGDYVMYEDYQKLYEDYLTLLNRYNFMAERIKDIYLDIV